MGFFGPGQFDWNNFLQDIGVIGSLLLSSAGFGLAVITFRRDIKARRFSNRIAITENHRELSIFEISREDLSRIREIDIDLTKHPLRNVEAGFLWQRILHLSCCFQGIKTGEFEKPDELERNIQTFFARPLSRIVWEKAKAFQSEQFVAFVDKCLRQTERPS
jgi:hypothetical protein